MEEWININDRLPCHLIDILCTDSLDIYICYLSPQDERFYDSSSGVIIKTTHWMQLPKLPQVKTLCNITKQHDICFGSGY